MSTQLPASLSYMCNCDEAGAQEVPIPSVRSPKIDVTSPNPHGHIVSRHHKQRTRVIEFIPGMFLSFRSCPSFRSCQPVKTRPWHRHVHSFCGDGRRRGREGAGICLPGISFMGLVKVKPSALGVGFCLLRRRHFMPGIILRFHPQGRRAHDPEKREQGRVDLRIRNVEFITFPKA